MSTAMHMAIGYGLHLSGLNTDLIKDHERMEDKELFQSFVYSAKASAAERKDISDRAVLAYTTGTDFHAVDEPITELHQMISYDWEFAFDDRLILYPGNYKQTWYRYRNLLDAFAYEAYVDPNDPQFLIPEWREKPGTLYPFVGLMRANPDSPHGVEEYWENCYLDSNKTRNAIPVAPRHLWYLIKHLGLTQTDEETTAAFLSLRPTLMRWWS